MWLPLLWFLRDVGLCSYRLYAIIIMVGAGGDNYHRPIMNMIPDDSHYADLFKAYFGHVICDLAAEKITTLRRTRYKHKRKKTSGKHSFPRFKSIFYILE
eukprot:TRINITY_DN15693_c0_g1_i2.p1 TRINITY_DN15693_c0_g1~~TRINITY_DN15693_c0_g1_i2.p1  ORF type:complete len:100 (-),score=5.29 TRINITY_DN15693_c0_g1_i2:236-535(-)